jgi:hypothetical protein
MNENVYEKEEKKKELFYLKRLTSEEDMGVKSIH